MTLLRPSLFIACIAALAAGRPQGALAQTTAPAAKTPAPIAQVKYIPQRLDDIAWENDRIAFRIYGPKLAVTHPAGSGIDVWVKSVRSPIIDKWYKNGHYHEDHGEGLDCYGVGNSRGCGGLGIWDGKTLAVSDDWSSYQITEASGDRAVFTVNYAPWKMSDGHEVSEKRTFTLAMGTNLNVCQSTLTSDEPELVVGIGVAKRKDGKLYEDKEKGILAFWQPNIGENGSTGLAVLVRPEDVVGFAEDKHNNILLIKAKSGVPFTYRCGACWSKGLDFHTFDEWKSYLQKAVK